jgi:hypothetical protein
MRGPSRNPANEALSCRSGSYEAGGRRAAGAAGAAGAANSR